MYVKLSSPKIRLIQAAHTHAIEKDIVAPVVGGRSRGVDE